MGRAPCCEKEGLRRGAWSADEDQRLVAYIQQNGHPNWRALPRLAGLLRCGKSCRLRWINYLRPDIKRGNFSADEEALIVRLHRELGNRWSAIAAQLPGRTDNEIKNVWHTHIKKRLEDGGGDDGEDKIKKARKSKPKPAAKKRSAASAKKKAADADGVDNSSEQQQPFLTAASPGLSSSVSSGVTFSTATDSAAAVSSSATTSSHQQEQHQQVGAIVSKAEMMETESFSSELFPPIDDSFWSSADVMDMGLGAMDEELGLGLADPLPSSSSTSTTDEDMEFWLKMLMEAGDMSDLSVVL